jgi:hypothetical protein
LRDQRPRHADEVCDLRHVFKARDRWLGALQRS